MDDEKPIISMANPISGMSEEAKEAFAKKLAASTEALTRKTKGVDTFKGKVINILAMGPSRGQCDFKDETWGVNTGWTQARVVGEKVDKVFLAHKQVYSPEGNPYFNWEQLNEQEFEMITLHDIPELNSTLFPLEEINEKFDTFGFYSDTICYMIAYALHLYTDDKLKLTEPLMLKLAGVDLQDFQEYQLEKGGIEFWLGYCKGLGVEFTLSSGCTLMTTMTHAPYGVENIDLDSVMSGPHWEGKEIIRKGHIIDYDVSLSLYGQIQRPSS